MRQIEQQGWVPSRDGRCDWLAWDILLAQDHTSMLDWLAEEEDKKGAVLQSSFFLCSLFNKQANKRTEGNQRVQSSPDQTPNESVKQL